MRLVFRFACSGDVPAVVDLVESAYRGESSRAGWTTEADLLDGQRTDAEAISAVVAGPGSVMLLAEAGGRLVGCCQLQQRRPHPPPRPSPLRPSPPGRTSACSRSGPAARARAGAGRSWPRPSGWLVRNGARAPW